MLKTVSSEKINILLIEDDPIDAELFWVMLNKVGASISLERVEQLQKGLERLGHNGIDMILLDLSLPDSLGFDTFSQVYAHAPHIPIVVLAGFGDETLAVKVVQAGAQDFLIKSQVEAEQVARACWYAVERQRATIRLRDREEQFRLLFENSLIGIVLTSLDGRFLQINRAFCEMVGYTSEELSNKTFPTITHPDDISFNQSLVDKALRGEISDYQLEKRYIHRDGRIVYALLHVTLIHDVQARPFQFIAHIINITERKQNQELLYNKQKFESLGILAGGVAHDLNNSLSAVIGQLSIAQRKALPDDPIQRHLIRAIKSAEHAAQLAQQMLAYSGRSRFEVKTISLNQIIRNNHNFLLSILPKHIKLQLNLAEELPEIEADVTQITQAINNLVINAIEAISNRPGCIKISTQLTALHTPDVLLNRYTGETLKPGHYIQLTIWDNGPGMDVTTLKKIFDPFFSTKFVGRGLGLPVVLGVVKGHEAGLRVESTIGKGTQFHLYFPVTTTSIITNTPLAPQEKVPHKAPLLLVVDDDPEVTSVISDTLELAGMQAITESNRAKAIDVYQERWREVDLIMLDVAMPGMGIMQALQMFWEINPDAKIVLTSGYRAEDIPPSAFMQVKGFIAKPYDLDSLIAALKRHLEN